MPEDSTLLVAVKSEEGGEEEDDGIDTPTLRRSKRRNKFHLDMAAMLSGNNPDRRLSPSPPPKGASLLKVIAKMPSTYSSLNVKHTHATRKASPAISEATSSDTAFPSKVTKSPRIGRPPLVKTEQKEDNTAHLTVNAPTAKKGSCCKGSLAKSVSPKHISQGKKVVESGKGNHWKRKAASTETGPPDPVSGPPITKSSNVAPLVESQESPKLQEVVDVETRVLVHAKQEMEKKITTEPIKVLTVSSAELMTAEKKANEELLGKRKRKVPLRHSDFSTIQDRDSDQDEVLFKSAKIEYTNCDGSKSLDDFSCTKCPAQFESRVGLTNHMKLHGAQKQFPCEHCDFCCTNKKTMRQHRRIHGIHKKQGSRLSPLKGIKANPFSLTMSPPPTLTTTSANIVKSPTSLAEMQPKMRAIDMALNLNLDEDGNPKPQSLIAEAVECDAATTHLLVTPLKIAAVGVVEMDGGFDEAMPVLIREEQLSAKKNEQKQMVNCQKEAEDAIDVPISSRKSVKCTECPFRTRSQARLQPHLIGHSRKSGFLCPLCNFKSESAGFLKRHCDLHKVDYKWPPDYVGIPQEQLDSLLAKERDRIEQESVAAAAAALLQNGIASQESKASSDGSRIKPRRLFNLPSSVSPAEEGRSLEAMSSYLKCAVNECEFRSRFKLEMVCHELRSHKDRFKQKKLPEGWPSPLTCKKCGIRVLGWGKLHVHNLLRHPLLKKSRKMFEEMLAERLQQTIATENYPYPTVKEQAEAKITGLAEEEEPLVVLVEPEIELHLDESAENGENKSLKQFVCSLCPFACSQLIRLSRHENKHLVKADHQCPNCSFSCRSTEILGQHLRLHNTIKKSSEVAVSKPENGIEEGGSAIGKRNELLKCADCPYKSKHGCDMKAHIKMHQEKRTYACSKCSYSSMRFNALKSHELLHIGMQPQHIKSGQGSSSRESSSPKLHSTAGERKLKIIKCAQTKIILGRKFVRGNREETFYRCRYCMLEMQFCSQLYAHSRHHFMETEAKHNCNICGFKTNLEGRLQEHYLYHKAIVKGVSNMMLEGISGSYDCHRAMSFKCTECPFHCDTYGKLWHHYQKHKKVSRFACNKCSFSAGSIQCLGEHMILHVESTPMQTSPKLPENNMIQNNNSAAKKSPSVDGEGCSEESAKTAHIAASENKLDSKPKIKIEPVAKNAPLLRKSATTIGLNTEKCCSLAIEIPPTHLDLLDRIRSQSATEAQDGDACSTSSSSSVLRCKECPFECSDVILEKLHADMHKKARRPFQCNMCSFNCFSAESLHSHLSLHAPPLSPISATHMRKRLATRKRNGVFQPGVEALPLNATNVLQCSQCNFKTVQHDRFMEHRMEHVQLLQQRLITTIKRSANEELLNKIKLKRVPKKADKLHSCSKCCFRCDTVIAYSRHMELHGDSGTFKCSLCDYSSNTHNIVLFHEHNHHLERSLTGMCNSLDMIKKCENKEEGSSKEKSLFPGSLNCTKCNFVCYELRDLVTHREEQHGGADASDKDKEISQMLKIGLVPRNAVGVV